MLARIIRPLKKTLQGTLLASMFLLLGTGAVSGCAALGLDQAKPPVTVSEVIQMTNEGVPAEGIIARIRDAKSVYRLDAAELAQLHDQGVADAVINYMQQTYLESVRREQSRADWTTWTMWRDHFW